MRTTTIPMIALAGIAPFMAGPRELRYYLAGCLLANGTLVATDGRAMMTARGGWAWEGSGVILPRELVLAALKLKGESAVIEVGDSGVAAVTVGKTTVRGDVVDGKYPDWQAVMAGDGEYAPTGFGPAVLEALVMAGKAVRKLARTTAAGSVSIRPMGDRAAAIGIGGYRGVTFLGCMMPERDSAVEGV